MKASAFLASTSSPLLASGYHAPIIYAIPIIVAVVLLKVVYSKSRGRPALVGKVVVRCSSKGHLFTTTWSPLGSLASVRLGFARFQRCPVGNHWALVKPVNDADLTEEDRRIAAAHGG